MKYKISDFLNLLFDESESTCFSETPNGTRVSYEPKATDLYFCINPLDPEKDNNPTEPYHSPNRPRRADANVTVFRNLLIELDSIPLESQIDYVTTKLPISSIVYSGGKSYHFIISLENPVPSIIEYQKLFKRIQLLLPQIDRACKNPSRLSRLPFATRKDTGNEQALIRLEKRIPIEHLLPCLPELPETSYNHSPSTNLTPAIIAIASREPDNIIREFNLSGRNQFFFWLHNRMKDFNYDSKSMYDIVNKAYQNLNNKNGFSISEAYMAARLK